MKPRRFALISLLMITAAGLIGCAAKSDRELEKIIAKEYEKSKGYVAVCQVSQSNAGRTTDYSIKITSVFGDYTEISFLKPEHLKEFTIVSSKGVTTVKIKDYETPLSNLPDGVSISSALPENWLYEQAQEPERMITMNADGKNTALLETRLGKVRYKAHIDAGKGVPLLLEASDEMDKKIVCDYQSFDYTR